MRSDVRAMVVRGVGRIRLQSTGNNVSALGDQRRRPANVASLDVARTGAHIDAIACRYRYFKTYPELRAVRTARKLLRQVAGNFHSGGCTLRIQYVVLQKLRSQGFPRIGLKVHRIPNNRRCPPLQSNDMYWPEIGGQVQRQIFSRLKVPVEVL